MSKLFHLSENIPVIKGGAPRETHSRA